MSQISQDPVGVRFGGTALLLLLAGCGELAHGGRQDGGPVQDADALAPSESHPSGGRASDPLEVGLGGASDPQAVMCEGLECCPANHQLLDLSNGDDIYVDAAEDLCIRTLGGSDAIHDEGVQTWIIAGAGDDVITATGAQVVLGGDGDDEIDVAIAGGEINGGDGDDWIVTGEGHHIVVPGPGQDVVQAGPGAVVVHVLDVCELATGESLSASGDDDVLVLPVPLSEAEAAGVSVDGFERIVVAGQSCLSSCAPSDCVPDEVAS